MWETKSALLLEKRANSETALGVTLSPKRAREPKAQQETWERCSVAQVVGGELVSIGHVRMLLFFMRDFAGRWKVLEHLSVGEKQEDLFSRGLSMRVLSVLYRS